MSSTARCPPAACQRTYEQLTQQSDTHRMVVLGKDSRQMDHYGHFDLLLGKRVAEEVFPLIEEWLWQHVADQACV